MTIRKHSPGCPCCECPSIYIGEWDEVSGTWSNDLWNYKTSSSNAIAISEFAGKQTHRVFTKLQCDDAEDIARIIVAWDSEDDYLYAEFETSSYYLGRLKVEGDPYPDVTTSNTGYPYRYNEHAPAWTWDSSNIRWDGIRWWLETTTGWWHSATMLGSYTPAGGYPPDEATGTPIVSALDTVPANIGPGIIRLYQVKDGITTQLGTDYIVGRLIPGEELEAEVCYDGTTLRARIAGASYGQDVSATGNKIGMATGAVTSLVSFNIPQSAPEFSPGLSRFNWYPIENTGECKCEGLWGACFNGLAPGYMKLVVSGVTSGSTGCDCSIFNGTWVIEPRTDLLTSRYNEYLTRALDLFDPICTFHAADDRSDGYISIGLFSPAGSVTKYRLYIKLGFFGGPAPGYEDPAEGRFQIEYDIPIKCLLFEDTTVPYLDEYDPSNHCSWSGATVKITSLS